MPPRARHLSVVPDVSMTHSGYLLRISLREIAPEIWRRFRVPATVTLDELHEIVQAVMGWENRHLHAWTVTVDAAGRPLISYKPEYAFADWGTDEQERDEQGVPMTAVLRTVGDSVLYVYDFGDHWEHDLVIEEVVADTHEVACLDGARACPPEDCGGPGGYAQLLAVRADPGHPDRDWLGDAAAAFEPEHFDATEVNDRIALERAAASVWSAAVGASALLAELDGRLPVLAVPDLIAALLTIDLGAGPAPVPDDAATLLGPLTRVLVLAADGITLTTAGYFPPAVVQALPDFLDPHTRGFREVDHHRIHGVRNFLRDTGLARVYRGEFVATKLGRKCAGDPQVLWQAIARRFPLGKDTAEREMGTIELAFVAAGVTDRSAGIGNVTGHLGYVLTDPHGSLATHHTPTRSTLALVFGLHRAIRLRPEPPISAPMRALARAILTEHP
ncbi:MAG: plasmid pRiA4b ORF-3 family protein [Gordonia sp. (in: high G+C Gram-positive bacteria)]